MSFAVESGVFDRLFDRRHQPLEDRLDELFEFRTRELHHEVLRTRGIRRDERQIDLGLHRARKLDLGLFSRLLSDAATPFCRCEGRCPDPS